MPLPDWLSAIGEGIGSVAELPFDVLGGFFQTPRSQNPSWLTTAGRTVGDIAHLPLDVLGGALNLPQSGRPAQHDTISTLGRNLGHLPFDALGNLLGLPSSHPTGGLDPEDPRAWKSPARYALAVSYMPDALNPTERAQRMSLLYQQRFLAWPTLIRDFRDQDTHAAEVYADPAAQAVYREGGPDAWKQRYPTVPLPPSRQITIHDYPPLDALDQAIAKAGGTDRVSLPEGIQAQTGPMFPSQDRAKALAYTKDTRNLDTLLGGTPEDQRAVQGLPPTLGYEAEKQRVLDQARNQAPFTSVFPGKTPTGAGPGQPAGPTSVDGSLGGPAAGPTTTVPAPAPAAAPTAASLATRFPPVELLPGESLNSFEQRKKAHEADLQEAVAAGAEQRKLAEARATERHKLVMTTQADQAYVGSILDGAEQRITPKALPQAKNFSQDLGGILGDVAYQGTQMTHTRNAYPEQASLMRFSQGMLGQVARRVSGEKGVLTEQDVSRAANLLPDERDTQETAHAKVKELRDFLNEVTARRLDPAWQPAAGDRRVGADLQPIEATPPAAATGAAPAATAAAPATAGPTTIRLPNGKPITVEY